MKKTLLLLAFIATGYFTTNAQYCAPTGTCTGSDFIRSFVMDGGINRMSFCDNSGYSEYHKTDTARIQQGQTHTARVSRGRQEATGTEVAIYIDWNQDKEFTEAERVGFASGADNFLFNIPVATDAKLGATRMRVLMSNGQPGTGVPPTVPVPITSACQEVLYEVEDYTIVVEPACIPNFNLTAPFETTNTTASASNDMAFESSKDHTYKVYIPYTADWVLSTCGSSFDTKVFIGTSCGKSNKLISNNNSCTSNEEFVIQLNEGVYYITIEGVDNAEGDYSLSLMQNGSLEYCDAFGNDCGFEHFTRVTIGEMDNVQEAPTCGSGNNRYAYQNWRAFQPIVMEKGNDYPMYVVKSSDLPSYIGMVYIDWNQDGDFLDADEETQMVIDGPGGNTGYNVTITPPTGALFGTTTMRLRIAQNTTPRPCGGLSRGEVEDYTIVLLDPATNASPIANDDLKSTFEDINSTASVLANDFDPEGALDKASLTIIRNPKHGLATIVGEKIEYNPDTLFSGFDTVMYKVCDSGTPVLCDSAIFRIEVLDDPSTTTAVNEKLASIEFSVFPNPVTDQLSIEIQQGNASSAIAKVLILTMQGVQVYDQTLRSNKGLINVSNLATGMYMIQIKNENGQMKSKTFVKE